ncbi:MAG: hypothetical protein AB8G99_02125 [Planctomycetaceae bacterium]
MRPATDNLRRAERSQTFYEAYAFLQSDAGKWMRRDVKVFDQSDGGLRIRSLRELDTSSLYVQLDKDVDTLIRCAVQRDMSVARNCWEYGLEALELAELHELIPHTVIMQYEGTQTPNESVGEIHIPNMEPEPQSVTGQLDALLGLPVDAPLVRVPRPELPLPVKTVGNEAIDEPQPIQSASDTSRTEAEQSAANEIEAEPFASTSRPAAGGTPAVPADTPVTAFPSATPDSTSSSERFKKCVATAKRLSAVARNLTRKVCSVIRRAIGDSVEPGSFFSNKSEEEHRRDWFDACAVKGEQSRVD